MAGRSTRQRGTPDYKTKRGAEGKDDVEMGRDYELLIKKMTQMERDIEENSRRWKVMEQDMKELKQLFGERMDKEFECDKGPGWMFERVEELSLQVKELGETIDGLRKTNDGLKENNKVLKQRVQVIVEENEALRERQSISEERSKEQVENLIKLKREQEGLVRVQDEKIIDFREIMKQQDEERKNNLEKQVIQVLKSKESVVRDMVEKKKGVIVFGLKERVLTIRNERVKEELKVAKDIIREVDDDNTELGEDIEEVFRLGKYEEGKDRPMKIKFKTQVAATRVLERTWKLAQVVRYKGVWIREDLNEEERARRNELISEAKEKNEQRSEEEKNRFYWKVLEGKIRKWFIKRE